VYRCESVLCLELFLPTEDLHIVSDQGTVVSND